MRTHVTRMSNDEAEAMFARIRWPETNGEPVCPICGGLAVYNVRRPKGPPRWRCKACVKEFTTTSGNVVRLAQDVCAILPRGHRDLLQPSEG
jgi:transposase-like protein